MPENDARAAIREEWVRNWVELVQAKRKAVADSVAFLPVDSTKTIESEDFLHCFSRLQALIAELFAREEEFLKMFGMPDDNERRHIDEHTRILDIFNDIYLDSMVGRGTRAVTVFERFRVEIEAHIHEYDLDLKDSIALPGWRKTVV